MHTNSFQLQGPQFINDSVSFSEGTHDKWAMFDINQPSYLDNQAHFWMISEPHLRWLDMRTSPERVGRHHGQLGCLHCRIKASSMLFHCLQSAAILCQLEPGPLSLQCRLKENEADQRSMSRG